jgi:hypothetical protein
MKKQTSITSQLTITMKAPTSVATSTKGKIKPQIQPMRKQYLHQQYHNHQLLKQQHLDGDEFLLPAAADTTTTIKRYRIILFG